MEKKKPVLMAGMAAETETIVTEGQTAWNMGSGRRQVLATPALVTLMEAVAQMAIDAHVPEDWESVGIGIELTHDAMTPVGMKVNVRAELVRFEGREMEFNISAWDEQGLIGNGRHRRMLARTRALERMLRQKS